MLADYADLGPCHRESDSGGPGSAAGLGPPLGRRELRDPGPQWVPELTGLVLSCGFGSLNTLPWGLGEGAGQQEGL